jgi:antitoxin component YwqK of YwqJK toxin-antitoxin module
MSPASGVALGRCLPCGLAILLLAGCGGGEIEFSHINEAGVLNNRPATFRDGGAPVSGTVVEKAADGTMVRRSEYRDGFPSGRIEEWHPNGQKKSERVVAYAARGPQDGGLRPAGPSRIWCDNGSLQSESDAGPDGTPKGVWRTFTCAGEPLSEQTMPFGPAKRWIEVPGNPKTALAEEGTTREGGGWDGVHRQFFPNGKPTLDERWAAGVLDGPYRTWKEDGEPLESGTYQAGTKVGTWVVNQGGREAVTEYDGSLFVDHRYAQAFMTAAGIYISTGTALNNARADEERVRYFIDQKLVDASKRLNLAPVQPGRPFSTTRWTYPAVLAASPLLPLLVEHGADLEAADSEGRTRLFYCIYSLGADRFCNGAEAKRLIALGIAPNHADAWGNTVLHEVVKTHVYVGGIVTNEKRLEVGTILMDAGADPDIANREGTTPLMLAVSARQFPLAIEMLNRSKAPAAVDRNRMNLVHLAFYVALSRQVHFSLSPEGRAFVTLAVSKGIDPLAPIGESGTLKAMAEQAGAIDMARFLAGLKR